MNHLTAFLIAALWSMLCSIAVGQEQPVLTIQAGNQTAPGIPFSLPISLESGDHNITALVFSLDLDTDSISFNDADDDMNGIPDGVVLLSAIPAVTVIDYDASDTDGELDFLFAELAGAPLPQGEFLRIELVSSQEGQSAQWITFADDPPISFGDQNGQDIPGLGVVAAAAVFSDGFESGNLSAWGTEDR